MISSISTSQEVSCVGCFDFEPAYSLRNHFYEKIVSTIQPDSFDHEGNWYRLIFVGNIPVSIKVMPSGRVCWSSQSPVLAESVRQYIKHIFFLFPLPHQALEHLPSHLAAQFSVLTPLLQISSATLAEALIKAIIRQVISAEQARKVLQRFIIKFGTTYEDEGMVYYGFPTPMQIEQLSLDELVSCGLGFKAKVVKHVCQRHLEENLEESISRLSPHEAIATLRSVKGIGDWSARIALYDFKHEIALYPFNDLAVRKGAKLLWSEGNWPDEPEAFESAWQQVNGQYTPIITFYLFMAARKTRYLSPC